MNRIEGTVPKAYSGMHKLKWLSVYNNRLGGNFPVQVANLQSLTHVFLQQNQFTGPKPKFTSPVLESYQHHGNRWRVTDVGEL